MAATLDQQGPGPEHYPEERRATGSLVAGCFAIMVASIALTTPASINGALQVSLHASGSQLTWVTDGVIVPTAALGLSFARLGDLWGRKRLLVTGSSVLAVGGLIALLAHSVQALWVGQAVQGVGVAAILAASLSLVTANTRTQGSWARAIATWSVCLALGNVAGPVLSGSIVEHAAWRWSYLTILIAGALAAIVVTVAASESRAPVVRKLDLPGQLLIGLAVLGACWGAIECPSAGWGSGSVVGAFVAAGVLLALFVLVESNVDDPIIRLGLFRSPSFSCSGVVAVLGMLAFVGGLYLTAVLLGVADQLSPFQVALHLLPSSLMVLILRPVLARIVARVPSRLVIGIGILPLAVGELWLSGLHAGQTGFAQVSLPLVVVGVGFAFLITGITTAAVNSAPFELAGMASGASTLMRQVGQSLGPAILGAVALSTATSKLTNGLAKAPLPPPLLHAAQGIAAKAGVVAVASAPLGPASKIAASSLASGIDRAYDVSACAVVVGALLALVFLGHGADTPDLTAVDGPATPAEASALTTT